MAKLKTGQLIKVKGTGIEGVIIDPKKSSATVLIETANGIEEISKDLIQVITLLGALLKAIASLFKKK